MMKKNSKRVLIAMSGGWTAPPPPRFLREHGYVCGGAMLRLYRDPEVDCLSARNAEDARRVAARLGMEFHLLDETERFSSCVMQKFIDEYCAGRTPNPCIDCNRELKFGALLDRALEMGYDYLATGHYARISYDEEAGPLASAAGPRPKEGSELCALSAHSVPAGPPAAAGGGSSTRIPSGRRHGRRG